MNAQQLMATIKTLVAVNKNLLVAEERTRLPTGLTPDEWRQNCQVHQSVLQKIPKHSGLNSCSRVSKHQLVALPFSFLTVTKTAWFL
jgi:hypothetical protein